MVFEHVREQCIHEMYHRILSHLPKGGNGGQMTTDGGICHDFEKRVLTLVHIAAPIILVRVS